MDTGKNGYTRARSSGSLGRNQSHVCEFGRERVKADIDCPEPEIITRYRWGHENRHRRLFADINDAETAGLEARNDTAESKGAYPTKESDIKATTEAKKKPVVDFKVKSDQKYQKPIIKDDDAKRPADDDASTMSPTSPLSPMNPDHSLATTKSMDATGVTIPFLLHGEPIAGVITTTTTTPTSSSTVQDLTSGTEEMRATEETTSPRGRALNISAPEPTNSLHANITDLSDVSMDEDDKEVEGKRCFERERERGEGMTHLIFLLANTNIFPDTNLE